MTTPLLSQYRNPPFKPPTRVSPSPSAAPRSPKRKRSHDQVVSPLTIDTSLPVDSKEDTTSGTNSPRMNVAQQLNDLQIDPLHLFKERKRPLTPARKRFKRALPPAADGDAAGSRLSPESCIHVAGPLTNAGEEEPVVDEASSLSLEIGETPGCRDASSHDDDDGSLNSSAPAEPLSPPHPNGCLQQATTQRNSPTLPPVANETPEPTSTVRAASPLPTQETLTPDQAAFTWREDEITGHEIDAGGDDDGEGINGVGFRPTPAIAYARKQRRRQQVNEWKAREARDARQKRIEKRRGGDVAVGRRLLDQEALKRSVRFAGVD